MILQRSLFRPMVDLLEDRNAPGEVFGLTALPISLLASINNIGAPPQSSFRQGQPQGKAVALVPLQILEYPSVAGNESEGKQDSVNYPDARQQRDTERDLQNARFDDSLKLNSTLTPQHQSTTLTKWSTFADEPVRITTVNLSDANINAMLSIVPHAVAPLVHPANTEFPPDAWLLPSFTEIGPGGGGTPSLGSIILDCETTPNQWLSNQEKQSPGWFSNVNWSDDDNDGWNIPETVTTSANPAAIYKPDRDDEEITNGDRDLRRFVVNVVAPNAEAVYDFSFTLTFGSKVRVFEHNTKVGPVVSGRRFSTYELSPPAEGNDCVKVKELWLEGYTASDAFLDVELRVEYSPVDLVPIPMVSTIDQTNITVFGVANYAGIFSGPQLSDDWLKFSNGMSLSDGNHARMSNDENGIISWDLPQYINWAVTEGIEYCQYFFNAMEMQGTVQPGRAGFWDPYYGYTNDPTIPWCPDPPFLGQPLVRIGQVRDVYVKSWF